MEESTMPQSEPVGVSDRVSITVHGPESWTSLNLSPTIAALRNMPNQNVITMTHLAVNEN